MDHIGTPPQPRDDRVIVRHDAPRVDDGKSLCLPVSFAIDAIARDARLVADN
jgi:hypothetical protein